MAIQTKIKRSNRAKSKIANTKKPRDYGDDPFFVKKAKDSKAFLEKNGFPKEILEKK